MQRTGRQVWRVRAWIRLAGLLCFLALAAQQADVIRRAGRGEMSPEEVRDGYLVLAALLLLVWRLAFHPRVTLEAGQVEIRNPVGRHRFAARDVQGFEMTDYGLRFQLSDGGRPYTFIFQDTQFFRAPRWLDLAEAVTGRRPTLQSSR